MGGKNEKSKYVFNYLSLKTFNDDKQLRSDWEIAICNGRERLMINNKKAHSTQKPEALLNRIILASSNPERFNIRPIHGLRNNRRNCKKTQ